jgi:glycogen debranching enzyme
MPMNVRKIIEGIPQPPDPIVLPSLALRSVISKTGMGVYASSDTLFKGAVFGRDSLEVAEDLLTSKPKLVKSILLTLARLQGLRTNNLNEEEPGKIVHEYRSVKVDGKKINKRSMEIFKALSGKWGGNDTEMAYYGSVDATPHFLRVLGLYTAKHGDKILNEKITRRDKSTVKLRVSAEAASDWLMTKLSISKSGMLEYCRVNPHGISNQVWKDSEEFYVHDNGSYANNIAPIASIEVQGLAYDALRVAGTFNPSRKQAYLDAAKKLRGDTISHLWIPESQYFSLGTDYDEHGTLRVIKTRTANPAALLDTTFFDDLEVDKKNTYISGIVSNILSTDFITDAGIRSRSLSASKLVPFWDYHGSFVSWPKETYDIAKGLRRHGFKRLARQLENRLLNVYLKTRRYPEFVYVDELGRVLSISSGGHRHGELIVVHSSNNPERVQAWTVSAIIAIIDTHLLEKIKLPTKKAPNTWQQKLENSLLASIPKVDLYVNPFSLSARYPTYRYELNKPAE